MKLFASAAPCGGGRKEKREERKEKREERKEKREERKEKREERRRGRGFILMSL